MSLPNLRVDVANVDGQLALLKQITKKTTIREVIAAPKNPEVGDTLQFDGAAWVAAPPPQHASGETMTFELDPFGMVGAHVCIECINPGGRTVFSLDEDGDYFYTIPRGMPRGTTIEFASNSPGVEAQFMLDDEDEFLRGAVVGCTGIISSWRTTKKNRGKQDYRQFRIRKTYGHGAHLILTKTGAVAPQWSLSGVCPRSNAGVRFEALDGSAEASDGESDDESDDERNDT